VLEHYLGENGKGEMEFSEEYLESYSLLQSAFFVLFLILKG